MRTIEELDMIEISVNAWLLLRRLNNDPKFFPGHASVTAAQIANQLPKTGKPDTNIRKSELKTNRNDTKK